MPRYRRAVTTALITIYVVSAVTELLGLWLTGKYFFLKPQPDGYVDFGALDTTWKVLTGPGLVTLGIGSGCAANILALLRH